MADCRIPKLKDELQNKLQEVNERLEKLPESLSDNPQGLLLNLCREFLTDVELRTQRNPAHPQFFKKLYKIFSQLQKSILATKLQFSVDFDDTTSPSSPIPIQAAVLIPQPIDKGPVVVDPPTPPKSPTVFRTFGDDAAAQGTQTAFVS